MICGGGDTGNSGKCPCRSTDFRLLPMFHWGHPLPGFSRFKSGPIQPTANLCRGRRGRRQLLRWVLGCLGGRVLLLPSPPMRGRPLCPPPSPTYVARRTPYKPPGFGRGILCFFSPLCFPSLLQAPSPSSPVLLIQPSSCQTSSLSSRRPLLAHTSSPPDCKCDILLSSPPLDIF